MVKQAFDLEPKVIGQAIQSRVEVSENQKYLGLQFAIRPHGQFPQTPYAIEIVMAQEDAMRLLSNLQKIQKLYDLPVPEGVHKMDKKP